jgi:hypothetical protein
MYDRSTIPTSTAVVYLLWIMTGATFIAGWVVMMTGHPHVAIMLGFTMVVIGTAGAVGTVRIYMIQICSLIRALHGLEDGPLNSGELHPIR